MQNSAKCGEFVRCRSCYQGNFLVKIFLAFSKKFEDCRSHAFNEDKIYSVVRADDIYELVRTNNEKQAKEEAFEKAQLEIITNLQHRVMQGKSQRQCYSESYDKDA